MSAVLNDPAISLRPMREADLPQVRAIEARAYQYPWTEGIFRDCLRVGYCCWVLEHEGELVGYGVMSVGAGESHILNLCVSPAYQRRGLGTIMLGHLLELARRHKAEACSLEVRPSNRAAIHLYHKAGFDEVGTRKSYYPAAEGREDALILSRRL